MNLWKIANNDHVVALGMLTRTNLTQRINHAEFQLSMAMLKKYTKIHKGTFLEIALKDTHLVDLRLKNEFERLIT